MPELPAVTQPTETQRTPVSIYEIQHWIKFPGQTNFIRVTETTKADPEREAKSYEPTYIDRKTQPKYNLGKTDTFSFEVDAMGPGGIQKILASYEDVLDVPVEYVRTCGYDFKAGKACEKTALVAKHAKATLNVSPFSGSDIAPIKIPFKVAITDEYEYGTFNYDTAAFTKAA